MILASLACAALLAAQAPAGPALAPPAKTAPMSVRVETPAKADEGTMAWARELQTALEPRKDEFRVARPGEKAELVVRIESLGKATDGTPLMNGSLVLGSTERAFTYSFKDVKVQAEALARNLRKFADQMKTTGK